MRTPLKVVGLALALSVTPLAAQEAPPLAPDSDPNRVGVFVSATTGSIVGMMAWVISTGIDSTNPSWGAAAVSTTLGSAVGGWLGAGADDAPGLNGFMVGALAGVAGGLLLARLTGGSDAHISSVALQYNIGQGLVTTWIGTRKPRRPGR